MHRIYPRYEFVKAILEEMNYKKENIIEVAGEISKLKLDENNFLKIVLLLDKTTNTGRFAMIFNTIFWQKLYTQELFEQPLTSLCPEIYDNSDLCNEDRKSIEFMIQLEYNCLKRCYRQFRRRKDNNIMDLKDRCMKELCQENNLYCYGAQIPQNFYFPYNGSIVKFNYLDFLFRLTQNQLTIPSDYYSALSKRFSKEIAFISYYLNWLSTQN